MNVATGGVNIQELFLPWYREEQMHTDGLVQNCIISSVLAIGILQSCNKPLMRFYFTNDANIWRYMTNDSVDPIATFKSDGVT